MTDTKQSPKFFDGFEPKTIRVDPIGPTAELRAKITALEAQLAALNKTFHSLQPRTFPFSCELCDGKITSPADYDDHGIGNCVDLCDKCNGEGWLK